MMSGCREDLNCNLDVLPEGAPQHFAKLIDGTIQFQIALLHRLPPAEYEQLAGKIGSALGGLGNIPGGLHLRRRNIFRRSSTN